ncbi:hypothetical protein D7Y13_01630 [Corallococcus praedator]|uniref:Uncharacterized protein n=1 Tax=Corallococcus praedator TaxID=2316724 RepID=A0ABX9QQQ1_9BACT|nr:hypothetical protein D7X75_01880 [Corallococcus sp. CA031C]RKI16993.1 hypothetical protein D7Y13_01630 [Corallococcus praedator]
MGAVKYTSTGRLPSHLSQANTFSPNVLRSSRAPSCQCVRSFFASAFVPTAAHGRETQEAAQSRSRISAFLRAYSSGVTSPSSAMRWRSDRLFTGSPGAGAAGPNASRPLKSLLRSCGTTGPRTTSFCRSFGSTLTFSRRPTSITRTFQSFHRLLNRT